MARRSSQSARRDDDEREPYRRKQQAPNMLPMFALLLLAVVGIGFAGWVQGKKADAAITEQENKPVKTDPSKDMESEAPPERGAATTKLRTTERAPEGLEQVGLWQSALKVAARGHDLALEAETAKKAEDFDTFNAKGREAWEKFNKALEDTAEWEIEIEERFGETDRQVRKIKRERSKWFKQLGKYRKTSK